MKILHITPFIGNESYGLGQVVINLAKSQALIGNEVTIWCFDSIDQVDEIKRFNLIPSECSIISFDFVGPKILGFSFEMIKHAIKTIKAFDIIHQHGIWTFVSLVTAYIANLYKVKYVIAPHGSLENSVLKKSKIKKKLALLFYEKRNLRLATRLHATSSNEIIDFKKMKFNQYFLMNNGISKEWIFSTGDKKIIIDKYGLPDNKKIMLYLSRVTPKKGLIMLIDALHSTGFANWHLVIVGNSEQGYLEKVINKVNDYGMTDEVTFLDPIFGDLKRDLFDYADVLVLPSFSEGFPMVVLDSLGASTPVLTTTASDWVELKENGCGWWINPDYNQLRDVLLEILPLSKETLSILGDRGKSLVLNKYEWGAIAQKIVIEYKSILGS